MIEEEMIRLNNEKRKQLTKVNEEYYGDMLVYLRASKVSQKNAEELALELLEHLIEAQKEGKTAEEVFGNDPRGYCAELVQSLPSKGFKTTIRRHLYMIFMVLTWMFLGHGLFGIIYDLIGPPFDQMAGFVISPVTIVYGVLSIVVIELILIIAKMSAFKWSRKKMTLVSVGIGLTISILFLGIAFLSDYLDQWLPSFTLSPWISLVLFGVGFLTNKLFFKNIDI